MNEAEQRQTVNDSAAVRASKQLVRDMEIIANQRNDAWNVLMAIEEHVDRRLAEFGDRSDIAGTINEWRCIKAMLGGRSATDWETDDARV